MQIAPSPSTASTSHLHHQSEDVEETPFSLQLPLWRGVLIDRIYQVSNNVHPGVRVELAAVEHLEELLIRLLVELLAAQPQSVHDVEKFVSVSFPPSMRHWVLQDANEVVASSHGTSRKLRNPNTKQTAVLMQKMQSVFKDVLGHKMDDKLLLYVVAILEYVTGDILKWTGNYVKHIRSGEQMIGLQNLKIALCADKGLLELMEMLHSDDVEQSLEMNLPSALQSVLHEKDEETSSVELSYEKVSRDFLFDETQYLASLNLIVHVFRRRFEQGLGSDSKHYLSIFGNIVEIRELSLSVIRCLEDSIEMSDCHCLGNLLWELAEAHEFDVYFTYAMFSKNPTGEATKVNHQGSSMDSFSLIERLLEEKNHERFFELEDRAFSGVSGGHNFRLAVKYVLPGLLKLPLLHFARYTEFASVLRRLSKSQEDSEDLRNTRGYLRTLGTRIEAAFPSSTKKFLLGLQPQRFVSELPSRTQLSRIQEIQKSIDAWEGKDIGFTCTEFIREGDLKMRVSSLSSTENTNKRQRAMLERHVFLFDRLIVFCKIQKTSYKFKAKLPVRKAFIEDLNDSDDCRHSFRLEFRHLTPTESSTFERAQVFCKNAEEKYAWMSSLVAIHTKSILDRMLNGYLMEEEKRIPLTLPTPDQYRFSEPDSDENIVFEEYTSNSGMPVVRHATVLKLVERLTYHQHMDNHFLRTFLTTFRTFCPPEVFLQLLIERFSIPTPLEFCSQDNTRNGYLSGPFNTVQSHGLNGTIENTVVNQQGYQRFRKEYQRPVQLRVLSVIRHWVNGHWYDFEGDSRLLDTLREFLDRQGRVTNQHKKWCSAIMSTIERKQRNQSTDSTEETNDIDSPKPTILWHTAIPGDIASYDLLSLHPVEIGRQVTMLQFDLYRAIKPIELVGAAWTKQDKNRRSPQLLKLTEHSTMLTYWVARCIVETASFEERLALFSRVLEIMCVFEQLNNFNGLVAFYSALNSSSVYRLSACWEKLDRDKAMAYDRFKQLCNPHWTEMIARLKSINPPCVPFFGHYLSRIFFFEEGNPTFLNCDHELVEDQEGADAHSIALGGSSRALVSFMKCRKIDALIADIQMYQNQPYQLHVEPTIRHFFESINPLQSHDGSKEALETYLFEQSHKVEPKNMEKIERMEMSRPIRSPQTLRSPGIKVSKVHQNIIIKVSKVHQNAYGGFKLPSSSRSQQQQQQQQHAIVEGTQQRVVVSSIGEEHFGIVNINPGDIPRYLGDVQHQSNHHHPRVHVDRQGATRRRRGSASPLSSPTASAIEQQQQQQIHSPPPPPLPPRSRLNVSQQKPSPSGSSAGTKTAGTKTPRSSASSPTFSTATGGQVFTFPQLSSSNDNPQHRITPPIVPPRRFPTNGTGDSQLPSPLDVHLWQQTPSTSSSVSVSLSVPLPPPLHPRKGNIVDSPPPPRPPKNVNNRESPIGQTIPLSSSGVNNRESPIVQMIPLSSSESPPPLPPKTYRRRVDR